MMLSQEREDRLVQCRWLLCVVADGLPSQEREDRLIECRWLLCVVAEGLLSQQREDRLVQCRWFLCFVSDGLLSQEREDVVERVAYLEKKVTQQEDEIVCLKSALADVIRRLGVVESGECGDVIVIVD